MDTYEYIIAVWTFAPFVKSIKVYNQRGETATTKLDLSPLSQNVGESQLMEVSNKLGTEGWEMYSATTIDYGRGNFTTRCFYRRKTNK